jgi:hypothetical protein
LFESPPPIPKTMISLAGLNKEPVDKSEEG